jgi:hypothetical protein
MNAAAPGLLRLPKTARFVAAKRASNDVTEPYTLVLAGKDELATVEVPFSAVGQDAGGFLCLY